MRPVTDYLPELEGSGYDGVPIKHVLQMSSGVGFDEDYGDPDSDINRMGRELAMGGTLLDFASTLERVRPPGTLQHYVSIDTQVLGAILVRATGQSLADYTSQKLWIPAGMESDAYWMVDGSGMEMAFGGLNASLRDFARLGRLFLENGEWNGRQIVPSQWVKASVTPDAPHLMPGPKPNSTNQMGYGYQWWIPADSQGDFMALGVYNQMIFVDPAHRLVIAKHSANRDFQRNDFEPTRETVALWRTIAADLENRRSGAKR
jgi:CubicO group peptidase (beta-lactamase class C family)